MILTLCVQQSAFLEEVYAGEEPEGFLKKYDRNNRTTANNCSNNSASALNSSNLNKTAKDKGLSDETKINAVLQGIGQTADT
ncbi:MAG: hypothetical protein IPM91_16105 [Bacteroidetes bacterium]|nr:hypothetical protein [Bacteroidota bacterium]